MIAFEQPRRQGGANIVSVQISESLVFCARQGKTAVANFKERSYHHE